MYFRINSLLVYFPFRYYCHFVQYICFCLSIGAYHHEEQVEDLQSKKEINPIWIQIVSEHTPEASHLSHASNWPVTADQRSWTKTF